MSRLPASPPPPPRPYAEFSLGFVLLRSAIEHGGAGARLDAIEGTLAQLVRRWRAGERLSAARDVRMAPGTLDTLLAWLESGDDGDAVPAAIDPRTLGRLGVYASGAVADETVPRGWIRVYIGATRPGSGEESRRLHG